MLRCLFNLARLPWDFLRVARVLGWGFTCRQFVQGCRLARALGTKRSQQVIRAIGGFAVEYQLSRFELGLLIETIVGLARDPRIDQARIVGLVYQGGRVIVASRTPDVQGVPLAG